MRINKQRVYVTPSAAIELSQAIHVIGRARSFQLPWRDRLAQDRPELVEYVKGLWSDTHATLPRGYELFALFVATNNAALRDLEPVWDRFPALVDDAIAYYNERARDLQAHPEAPVLTARLRRLSESSFQREYLNMLRALWDALGPNWERDGLPVIQVECARIVQRLNDGARLVDILPPKNLLTMEQYSDLIEEQKASDWMVTPLYYSQGGFLIHTGLVDLPLYLGYAIDTEGVHTAIQTKATEIAVRMKAFADPTRLTLLAAISGIEVTVGDLAKLLGITQPTVSGHLRTLERAGLVKLRKKGVKAYYRADAEAVAQLLDEAKQLLR